MAPRKNNAERIEDLVAAATAVFAGKGFRRARMDEIARAAGVSPGNIYNYVTSKDALFAIVMRRALNGSDPVEPPASLPIDGPPAAETIAWVGKRLDYVSDFPEFEAALRRRRVRDPAAEVTAVVNELFDVLLTVNDGATILERSGPEMPAVQQVFLERRRGLFERWTRFIERRSASGVYLPLVEPAATARLLIEATSWAARRRLSDPDPETAISDSAARGALIELALRTLIGGTPRGRRK